MKLYGTVNTEVDVSKYNILIAAAQILYDGHLYDSWGIHTELLEPDHRENNTGKKEDYLRLKIYHIMVPQYGNIH